MNRHLRQAVLRRADFRCEYCQMPQDFSDASHELDHVIAEKHRGPTALENLALACFECNNHKGPNISGIDPATGDIVRLFHPRRDRWSDHFVWRGPLLAGITAVGRTTVEVLAINLVRRLIHRQALIEEGSFPPPPTAE